MAISKIQQSTLTSAGGGIISLSATASGSLIVVMFEVSGTTQNITGITDDAGNTYFPVTGAYVTDPVSTIYNDIWYAKNSIAGATTLTVTFASAPAGAMIAMEYSGASLTNPVTSGANLSQLTTGQPSLGPVLTATRGSDLLVSIINKLSTNPTGVTAPWVSLSGLAGNAVNLIAPGSSGTYQAVYTPAQTDKYLSSGAVFQEPITAQPNNASMFFVF